MKLSEGYLNPTFEIKERGYIDKSSNQYKIMITRIYQSANSSNPRYYDLYHHSIETRTSKDKELHKNCKFLTPKKYVGESEKKHSQHHLGVVQNKSTRSW